MGLIYKIKKSLETNMQKIIKNSMFEGVSTNISFNCSYLDCKDLYAIGYIVVENRNQYADLKILS